MANARLKILVESHIPFIRGVLEPYTCVEYVDPCDITPERVRDCDAMIVRTRTRCDENLLSGSQVRLVLTATIGIDHIDLDYCNRAGITALNAPGCNAPAVAQYVFGSITALMNRPIRQHTLGIVGVGHVGSIVERWGRALGMNVLVCDPPRARREEKDEFVTLDTIASECDIITFHTPLTYEGPDATYHLADRSFFDSLRRSPIVINSARGPVSDTEAMIHAIESGSIRHAVVDCWENEPQISQRLLDMASIATPHIAGYSMQGKARATGICLNALSAYFNLPEMRPALPADFPTLDIASAVRVQDIGYNPLSDTAALKSSPEAFEALRNGYRLRTEPVAGKID